MANRIKYYICISCLKSIKSWAGNISKIKNGKLSGECRSCCSKRKTPPSQKGIKRTPETRIKMSLSMKGLPHLNGRRENSPNWKGGITSKNAKIRSSLEYIVWRRNIFERDEYTCVLCRRKGVRLNADHIKPFAYYPELRFEINNGRTLCKKCHENTPTFGGRSKL